MNKGSQLGGCSPDNFIFVKLYSATLMAALNAGKEPAAREQAFPDSLSEDQGAGSRQPSCERRMSLFAYLRDIIVTYAKTQNLRSV